MRLCCGFFYPHRDLYGKLNQCFPAEETKLASGTSTALARSCQWSNQTSVAASVRKLLVVFTAPTQLGQSIVKLLPDTVVVVATH